MPTDLTVFADYYQVLVFDEATTSNFADAWADPDKPTGLVVDQDALSVGTEVNVDVMVRVEITPGRPVMAEQEFDYLAEASIEVRSGQLVVMGCTDFQPEAARFGVPPGWVRVLVGRSNLDVAQRLGLESDESADTMERLSLWVWPEEASAPVVFKRWEPVRG
ncbi:hypothetical protein [Micromonospora chersina]|uniref:hypothetical protein n=1 Tax=Micromonospora chersina TaxID=47854 RepID=UPI00371E5575